MSSQSRSKQCKPRPRVQITDNPFARRHTVVSGGISKPSIAPARKVSKPTKVRSPRDIYEFFDPQEPIVLVSAVEQRGIKHYIEESAKHRLQWKKERKEKEELEAILAAQADKTSKLEGAANDAEAYKTEIASIFECIICYDELSDPHRRDHYPPEEPPTNEQAHETSEPAHTEEPDEPQKKRKRYESSDHPMQAWLKHRDEYLDELLRLEGRGDEAHYSSCGSCGTKDGVAYRCKGQECQGYQMFCKACTLSNHQYQLLHWIEEWLPDHYFRRTSLQELGLRIQLGHPPRSRCTFPRPANKDFVVIHTNGIHRVAVDFCGCDSSFDYRRQVAYPYKYWLYLAEDANFRMRNRFVSNEQRDPILGDGWGYMVKKDEYYNFLKSSLDIDEISSCSSFAALVLANLKRSKGLRSTGIGGVCCARHNMWRAQGMGELQKGERYSNMTFILFSALLAVNVMTVVLSYDIACQFDKNLARRMEQLPAHLHIDEDVEIATIVPNFHLPAHRDSCHSRYSYHYLNGGGNGNGEGIEQNWVVTNGVAYQARHMGPGGFRLLLETTLSYANWRKVCALATIQRRRTWEAVQEAPRHGEGFREFRAAMFALRPQDVERWDQNIAKWEEDDSHPSPYQMHGQKETLKDVKLQLAHEERMETASRTEVPQDRTPSTLVLLGVQIEDMQAKLRSRIQTTTTITPTQSIEIENQRASILKLIIQLRAIQEIYMPHLEAEVPGARPTLNGARVSHAAAGDALEDVRHGLRARSATHAFKNKNLVGNKANTRGQTVLREIDLKIHLAVERYRRHRSAYLTLKGTGSWESDLKELRDDDVRFLNERTLSSKEREEEDQHRRQGLLLTLAPSSVPLPGGVAAGESRRTLSWIWLHAGADIEATALPGADQTVVEALGVEYCRAKARARRWYEEVVLLEEEMRRSVVHCHWVSGQWGHRGSKRTTATTAELKEGLAAYAAEQSSVWEALAEKMSRTWEQCSRAARAHLRTMDAEGNILGELASEESIARDIGRDLKDGEDFWLYDTQQHPE
ncbi:uncharacterized protein SCHCODRAFT_02598112 [Schizophyllum commune H4-8]|uniref:uncharacterized protein n=1 Tax=Schizophyllum commune (strain H4-8 / FGSC 9210) TaxID=578458 RepID=UPI00215DE534|nr:uncharacterized protein SCHCODRAFT_02598112 [Schizophyllum commune H4-8]KAI5894719.1 hypothetical protein SCHCODRAFT_02598112 [Schizophyllum commune H4-8]